MERKHYESIDGLRTLAAIGIIMMHMKANNTYGIQGMVYNDIIPLFTNFVFLFMTVSAFGMCCGYYEKIVNNKISICDFYEKRYKKILPFFSILVLIDVIMSLSVESIYEGFADLTLLFGFLPNAGNISVIGVGWFLGLIFVFYLCFPFFCFLLENRKRAWFAFWASILYNILCATYFEVGRTNILYCACYFLAGGLVYLYREEIEKISKWLLLGVACIVTIIYCFICSNVMMSLLLSVSYLGYAMVSSKGLLSNRFTKFFSSISMEVYLCHMVIFRILEKMKLNTILENGWLQYILTVIMVLIGSCIFALVVRKIIEIVEKLIPVVINKR